MAGRQLRPAIIRRSRLFEPNDNRTVSIRD
jgi:hypothetical protein